MSNLSEDLIFDTQAMQNYKDEDKQITALPFDKIVDVVRGIFSGDDDMDGVPNYRDQLNGTNDNVDKTHLANGDIIAHVGQNVYAVFDADGNQYDGYFTRSLSGMTSGTTDHGVGLTLPPGIGVVVTYTDPEATYSFQPTPYGDADIIVEGSH